jgi:hypothetical protein
MRFFIENVATCVQAAPAAAQIESGWYMQPLHFVLPLTAKTFYNLAAA